MTTGMFIGIIITISGFTSLIVILLVYKLPKTVANFKQRRFQKRLVVSLIIEPESLLKVGERYALIHKRPSYYGRVVYTVTFRQFSPNNEASIYLENGQQLRFSLSQEDYYWCKIKDKFPKCQGTDIKNINI